VPGYGLPVAHVRSARCAPRDASGPHGKASGHAEPIKQVRRAMHPIDNMIYAAERSVNTKPRRKAAAPVYRHASCSVNHRSPEAAATCRRTY
jgi:hypothetical protein